MSVLGGPRTKKLNIIDPWQERTLADINDYNMTLTYGQGPAGYDIRVEFDNYGLKKELTIEPNEFTLCSSIEHFTMPRSVMGQVCDKSTWARLGLVVQNTHIDPGWNGFLTLELTNHSKTNIILKRGYPIAQVIFHDVDEDCMVYAGKYQTQKRGPQEAK